MLLFYELAFFIITLNSLIYEADMKLCRQNTFQCIENGKLYSLKRKVRNRSVLEYIIRKDKNNFSVIEPYIFKKYFDTT